MPTDILTALDARDWYAVAALALFALLQAWRNAPLTGELWKRIPEGQRWIVPVVMGAVAGFTDAYQAGQEWRVALLQALAGVVYIALPAMGARGLMREIQKRDLKELGK